MVELPDLARRLLEGKNFATVATLMADGGPQATVVWIDTDGAHIVFNTAEGRVKPRNMRRDARVAVAVFDQENPYQQAMIQGRVVAMEHEGRKSISTRWRRSTWTWTATPPDLPPGRRAARDRQDRAGKGCTDGIGASNGATRGGER